MTGSSPLRRRKQPNTRLLMISAVLGALLVLVVSAVLNWPMTTSGGGGSSTGGSGQQGPAAAPAPVYEARPGSCLNWTTADAADLGPVACEQPHLFEVTGRADLSQQFGDDAPYPDTATWQRIKQQRCTQVSQRFLSDRLDPNGRFAVGAFTPSSEGWFEGDRVLHCGLQQPGPSGALYPIVGPVATQDQSDTYDVGRCLGINGVDVWDPVDCGQPHSVEITGTVNLGDQFPGGYPAEGDQDGFLADRCRDLTAEFAGSPDATQDKGLIGYWDTLSQESWNAGSRTVNCKVSAQLPDGSGLAPVTGSIQGEVQVGDAPAPENRVPVEPGVPATGER
ncbi:hypothetical protein GIY23_00630 [Allosaccharopolyspora coralli]|uniref:Septum formation-related domain-containing protein n=1 Tax=Allosaccharopolyspora coralli TaxID=2665642 RepID=A0A5Q3Q175_9PSEU|nr:septum formation family protein [Allosaccharopolyspora coralli]QGK68271.1 hypothetical protein GIY23_00630 [Allosaccharopolyspora coralli]